MDQVHKIFDLFMNLLSKRLPDLHKLLEGSGMGCSLFLHEWVVCLYSNILPEDMCQRIWDNILFYGEYFIIKSALAIC